MIQRSWSIRIEAPKPPPPPPRSTASKVAHWAGIPHYRLPRFNLTDEAMLQELQTEELEEEDYSLLPSRSSTLTKPRHEVQLVNVPDRQGFTDRAKPGSGKLRKSKPSKSSSHDKPSRAPDQSSSSIAVEETKPVDSRIIPGDVHGDKTVPADFDSSSTDYPRHPRTPDRYMPSLSRGPSQRERRNSLSSTSDQGGDHSFNDSVKAPVALRKSPPQFLQHWDDSNPYYYSRYSYHEPEHSYSVRSRPTNRSLSISSSGRLPILHESHYEFSGDDINRMSRAQTMPSGIQTQSQDISPPRQRRPNRFSIEAERTAYEHSASFSSHPDSSNIHSSQYMMQSSPQQSSVTRISPSSVPARPAAPFSPDEAALTEMSTEILIAGERVEKRPHPPHTKSIVDWVKRVMSPLNLSGTPKTIPSVDVEIGEDEDLKKSKNPVIDEVWKASPLTAEITNPDVPIPVPTRTPPKLPPDPVPQPERQLMSPSPPPKPTPTATLPRVGGANSPREPPNAEETGSAKTPETQRSRETSSNPVTLVPVLPLEPPARPPPPPPKLNEQHHSPLSGPIMTFTIDPKAAEKRRMTVAFGITPLQRRETAELAQDVMRRVSGVGTRRGSLASVIRVVDTLLVREREEQLRRARRAEMAWD